ncbi:Hypothetical predicted protein [Octopus vulgaris]|uniref:Uncharacterized protein n=1 Tax=Octopus vulgaris TaxID=6645 RepID=A0AA36AYL0_OCTVU|nr:Hypothetical predicted protein [Octopus vulgaris]
MYSFYENLSQYQMNNNVPIANNHCQLSLCVKHRSSTYNFQVLLLSCVIVFSIGIPRRTSSVTETEKFLPCLLKQKQTSK